MSVSYDYDGIEVIIEGEECPDCSSIETYFDRTFGFWKCQNCSTIWGHDKDDPDHEDVEEIEEVDRP
jgi:ribosomal protein L37AE/L43A